MTDVFSKQKRSLVMAAILSRGNIETELALWAILKKNHITGWRRNSQVLGKPDFVFPASRVAVFVDGCFWHKCPEHFRLPKSNRRYWGAKITRNVKRDLVVTKQLRKAAWRVIRVWQHELADEHRVARRIRRVLAIAPRDRQPAQHRKA